jgi:hypothetical protein
MSNWKDDKRFKFGKITIHSTKAKPTDPVKWYTEVHKNGVYWSSHGSHMPLRLLAVLETLAKMPRSAND